MSSGFITETEALEARRKRQEEWDRVRKSTDPAERPEEPYDHRSLYEKLQEQKQKKELEYEEAHKLKNMIKGLDDDEIDFLELVDRTKLAADRKKTLEEEKELDDYRNRVATLHQQEMDQKIYTDNLKKPKTPVNNRTSQIKLLKGAVVKKTDDRKRKHSETESEDDVVSNCHRGEEDDINPVTSGIVRDETITGEKINVNTVGAVTGVMKCIGILPGMGCYDDSSSDDSSNSDVEDIPPPKKMDLLGRKIAEKKH